MPFRTNIILPDNWPERREAALREGETEQDLFRAAINRELKARKQPPLDAVRKRGKPKIDAPS